MTHCVELLKNFRKSFLVTTIFLLFLTSTKAYQIEVHLTGLQNISIHLAEFYIDSYYIIDTARLDHQGNGVFTGKPDVDPGIYYLVLPNRNSIELVLGIQQDILVETSMQNPIESLQITGSDELSEYINFQKFISRESRAIEKIKAQIRNDKEDLNIVYQKMKEIAQIKESIENRKLEIIKDHPKWALSNHLRLTIDHLKRCNTDSMNFEKKIVTYFQDYDLSGEYILRTPEFKNGITHFLNRYSENNPETIGIFTRFVLQHSMTDKIKSAFLDVIHEYITEINTPLIKEHCMVSMAEVITRMSHNKMNFNYPSPSILLLKNTFKGQTLPQELTMHAKLPEKFILAIWNPDCAVCEKDKAYVPNASLPVKVLYTDGLARPNHTHIDVETLVIPDIEIVFSAFPVTETPVYFLVENHYKIVRKSYSLSEIL